MIPLLVTLSLQLLLTAPEPVARPVRVLLVVQPSDTLPTPFSGVRAEVERIWRGAGVEFTWASRLPQGDLPVDRIIAIHVSDADAGDERMPTGALGGVPRVAGRMRQIIYVSPSAITRLVVAAGVSPRDGHFAVYYARTLGRVVAHELGHLLLDSSGHSETGLMRPSFGPPDVVSADAARFRPGVAEVTQIHDRVAMARLQRDAPQAPVVSANRSTRRR